MVLATRTLLLVLSCVAALPDPAQACTCEWRDSDDPGAFERDVRTQFDGSNAVFAAEVVAVGPHSATMRVEQVWKGTIGAVLVMGTGSVPTADGLVQHSTCILDFRDAEGTVWLVFADRSPDGRLTAHRCGHTRELRHSGPTESILNRIVQPVRSTVPVAAPHDAAQIRADLEAHLAPVAVWRTRTEEALRASAGTAQADPRFLDLRIQLKAIVATIARDLEAPEFQRLMFPDGAAGQAFRRAQRRPFDAEASALVEADALMAFMKERGVWPHRAEGDIYFYVSEAALLEWFGPSVSEEIRQFLRLWADEQVRPAAEDASIQVDFDELERRIRATEGFLAGYPESKVREPMRVRHQHYLALYLGGTDNTPAFDRRSGVLRSDLRQRIEAYAAAQPLTPSGLVVATYLDLLRTTRFARTPEVRHFLDGVRGDVGDWRLLRY